MNTDFPLKAQDAIIGDVIIYPEMDMSRTDQGMYRRISERFSSINRVFYND